MVSNRARKKGLTVAVATTFLLVAMLCGGCDSATRREAPRKLPGGAKAEWSGMAGSGMAAAEGGTTGDSHAVLAPKEKVKYWTCVMDPEVKESAPGKCPVCRMNLVPVE